MDTGHSVECLGFKGPPSLRATVAAGNAFGTLFNSVAGLLVMSNVAILSACVLDVAWAHLLGCFR